MWVDEKPRGKAWRALYDVFVGGSTIVPDTWTTSLELLQERTVILDSVEPSPELDMDVRPEDVTSFTTERWRMALSKRGAAKWQRWEEAGGRDE